MPETVLPTISFVANHVPPLPDETYTLTLTQTLIAADVNQTFTKTHKFAVQGERFAFRPNLIHKVFPPPGTQGDYDSLLPHVVLTRRTLPWERTPFISGSPQSGLPSSWLALLVFTQDEAPNTQNGTLKDLYPSTSADSGGLLPAGTYSYGSATPAGTPFLGYGEKSTDACVWFDLDRPTFCAYAPSLKDLQWVAHARVMTRPDGTSDDYAVIVASRVPEPGQTAVVHLVSLAELGSQLPQDDGTMPAGAAAWNNIRLVSLKSWSFKVGVLQASFDAVLSGLNGGTAGATQRLDSQLRLPASSRPAAAAVSAPASAFDAGYTVLAGSQAGGAAWYRGPLAPCSVAPAGTDTWSALLPANHALGLDAPVARFVPAMDRSYSAAWQLGRLLALADRDFATTQVTWKRDCRSALNVASHHDADASASSRAAYALALRTLLNDKTSIQKYLGNALTTGAAPVGGDLAIPQKLVDWLAKLALLNSVPFHYLVPDAIMLPPESIRFFNIDPRWIASLLDGAWSLGREPRETWAFDTLYQPWSQLQAGTLVSSFAQTSWPVSGVLLNTRLISGYWPGIVFAPDSGVTTLREDRLSPNTVLLLFDKPIAQLTIQEPPEGVHFGFDRDDKEDLQKSLRHVTIGSASYPSGSAAQANGSDITPVLSCKSVPLRNDNQVIQLSVLAGQMAAALGVPTASFTTAEFALELVEKVPSVTFNLPHGS